MIVLAWAMTVVLLLFVSVMVWRCWKLPPVPAIRLWALGVAGMTVNCLYQFWRAEIWKKEAEKLELKLQGQRLLPRRQVSPKTGSFYRDQRIPDTAVRFVLPATDVRLLTAMIQFEPDIDVHISALADRYQKIQVGLQNIVRTQPISRSAFGDSWPSLLPLSEIGLCLPYLYANELRLCNREAILSASWQNETLAKRLWSRSKRSQSRRSDKGEDLLESEDLKRQLREAKERLESIQKPPGQ